MRERDATEADALESERVPDVERRAVGNVHKVEDCRPSISRGRSDKLKVTRDRQVGREERERERRGHRRTGRAVPELRGVDQEGLAEGVANFEASVEGVLIGWVGRAERGLDGPEVVVYHETWAISIGQGVSIALLLSLSDDMEA